MTDHQDLPERLRIVAWTESDGREEADRLTYLFLGWLPRIGPTATVLWLLATDGLRTIGRLGGPGRPEFTVVTVELGAALGVKRSYSRHTALPKAAARLVDYRLARWSGDAFEVRTALPPLTAEQFRTLPPACQHALRVLGRAPISLG